MASVASRKTISYCDVNSRSGKFSIYRKAHITLHDMNCKPRSDDTSPQWYISQWVSRFPGEFDGNTSRVTTEHSPHSYSLSPHLVSIRDETRLTRVRCWFLIILMLMIYMTLSCRLGSLHWLFPDVSLNTVAVHWLHWAASRAEMASMPVIWPDCTAFMLWGDLPPWPHS